jgi:phenylalanyl-tRNA synthetase beta chain
MTSPEREARLYPAGATRLKPEDYLRIQNPVVGDRDVMRRSLLSSLMEVVERNARLQERLAIFEIGEVFIPGSELLPDEPCRLAIVLTGPRDVPGWQGADLSPMDLYDLKGIIDASLEALHVGQAVTQPAEHPSFHPGKCARLLLGGREIGVFGELHPLVRQHYELPATPLLAAELDLESILQSVPDRYNVRSVPAYPPVLEDLAVVVDEGITGVQVDQIIREAGGEMVIEARLFDIYRGEQAGAGQKSLAYRLTYQAQDRTLTDQEVAQIRQRIVRQLEEQLGAKLRS